MESEWGQHEKRVASDVIGGGWLARSDRHTGDLRLEDEFSAHDALRLRDEAARGRLDLLDEDHELIAGNDLPSERGLIATQKAEESERRKARAEEPACALRGRLDHQHARVERTPLDVVLAPELIRPDVLHADALSEILTRPDDAVALPHRSRLGQELIEATAVADGLRQVDGR